MKLHFYVNFKGTCREAFDFYERYLGGKITSITTFGELPFVTGIDEKRKSEIAHGRIEIGGAVLMGADVPHAEPMRSAYLTLLFDNAEETDQAYERLAAGGEIFQKIETTAFAERYAMLRDRYGASWMILCQKEPFS
jgi:PhnB protein